MAKKSKMSLRDRLASKKEELKKKGQNGNVLFLKEGTIRVRVLPTGEDNDFVMEVNTVYLGPKVGGVISPSTFGEPCAIKEAFTKLSNSKNSEDKSLAKKLTERKKYLMPCIIFTDLKGKNIDEDKGVKLVQIPGTMYQEIIDYYLDEDEWGDLTDPKKGYDLKLTRSGSGKNDTTYSVQPCKNTQLPKEWAKPVDLEELVRAIIPSYEDTEEKLNEFMIATESGDDDEDDSGKGSKPKKVNKPKRKKDI